MLGRVQPQKSFGDEALELHVSDDHFQVKSDRLVDRSLFGEEEIRVMLENAGFVDTQFSDNAPYWCAISVKR